MKNITITLDEKTAAWARVHAAKNNKSVSRLVGEMLEKQMRESSEYWEAYRQWRLSMKKVRVISQPGQRYPTREEIHDRASLRRR